MILRLRTILAVALFFAAGPLWASDPDGGTTETSHGESTPAAETASDITTSAPQTGAPATPTAGNSGKVPPGQTKKMIVRKPAKPTPQQIKKWSAGLKKNLFTDSFRKEYEKALGADLSGALPGTPVDGGNVNDFTGGVSIDLGSADGEARGAEDRPTVKELLVERFVVTNPETKTRLIFVERLPTVPTPTAAPGTDKATQGSGASAGNGSTAAGDGGGGMLTIIPAKPAPENPWDLSRPSAPKWDRDRAERDFKALDTYLAQGAPPSSGGTATAEEKPAPKGNAPTARKVSAAEEDVWVEQVVYLDSTDGGTPEVPAAAAEGTRLTARPQEAAGSQLPLSLQTLASTSFHTLRSRAQRTPWSAILLNLGLTLTGLVLLGLMWTKRRRMAPLLTTAVRRTSGVPAAPPPIPMATAVAVSTTPQTPPGFRPLDEAEAYDDTFVPEQSEAVPMSSDIRVVFDPRSHRWVLKRKEEGGRLSPPLAELQTGTVVYGTALGASSPEKRYRLSASQTWIPTEDPEQIIIAVTAQNFRAAR